jgi:hypothetical protein
MVSRLRFIGRWVGVVFGTLAWLVVVPLLELGRAVPGRLRSTAPGRDATTRPASRPQSSPARS